MEKEGGQDEPGLRWRQTKMRPENLLTVYYEAELE